jgi:hypothetical protein
MNGYKLLVTYNVLAHREMEYRRFVIQRWLPGMQEQGLEPGEILHTLWGEYPSRLIVLYAPDLTTMQQLLTSAEWQSWHEQLDKMVRNLEYQVVPARPWMQF